MNKKKRNFNYIPFPGKLLWNCSFELLLVAGSEGLYYLEENECFKEYQIDLNSCLSIMAEVCPVTLFKQDSATNIFQRVLGIIFGIAI